MEGRTFGFSPFIMFEKEMIGMDVMERQKILDKANERGYELVMYGGEKNWHSLYNDRYRLNLEVYVDSGRFVLSHMKGIVKITTGECGSFMNDGHFKRIEREIRKIVVDLI